MVPIPAGGEGVAVGQGEAHERACIHPHAAHGGGSVGGGGVRRANNEGAGRAVDTLKGDGFGDAHAIRQRIPRRHAAARRIHAVAHQDHPAGGDRVHRRLDRGRRFGPSSVGPHVRSAGRDVGDGGGNQFIRAHVRLSPKGARVAVQVRHPGRPGPIGARVDARRGAGEAVIARRGVHELRIVGDATIAREARSTGITGGVETPDIVITAGRVGIHNAVIQRPGVGAIHPAAVVVFHPVAHDGAIVQRPALIAIRPAAAVKGRVAAEEAVVQRPALIEVRPAAPALRAPRVAGERAVVHGPRMIEIGPAAGSVGRTAGQHTVGDGPAMIEKRAAARTVIVIVIRRRRVAVGQRKAAHDRVGHQVHAAHGRRPVGGCGIGRADNEGVGRTIHTLQGDRLGETHPVGQRITRRQRPAAGIDAVRHPHRVAVGRDIHRALDGVKRSRPRRARPVRRAVRRHVEGRGVTGGRAQEATHQRAERAPLPQV